MPVVSWPLEGDVYPNLVWTGPYGSVPDSDVPALMGVSIGGIDLKVEVNQVRRKTIDALRAASFQGATPSEASLSTEAAWLRTQRTWRYGSGLVIADSQDDGLDNIILGQRYDDGFHAGPTQHADGLSLLRRASGNLVGPNTLQTAGKAVAAGSYTFALLTNGVHRIDAASDVLCTGFGTDTPRAIASDGYTIWVLCSVDATHVRMYSLTVVAGTAFTAMTAGSQLLPTSGATNYLMYANGFLLAFANTTMYSVSPTGSFSAAIDTISTVSTLTGPYVIVGTASPTFFYFSIGASNALPYAIFKISVDSTGIFGKFSAAAPAFGPTESVGPILVDNGLMLVGTNLGFYCGQLATDGNISFGPQIALVNDDPNIAADAPNYGVTAFARFRDKIVASFSFGDYLNERFAMGVNTSFYGNVAWLTAGTFVIDTGRFTDILVPSWSFWWRDITKTGSTTRCVIAENRDTPVAFLADGYRVIGRTNLFPQGVAVSSWYTFGLDAKKTFVDVEIAFDPLATGDSIAVYFQGDDDPAWNQAGAATIPGSVEMAAPIPLVVNVRKLRLAFVLTAGSVTQTTTPHLRRFQLRAYPTPRRTEEIIYPAIVHDDIRIGEGEMVDRRLDTRSIYDQLAALVMSGVAVQCQEGDRSFLARVDSVEIQPDHWSMDRETGGYRFYQGYYIVRVLTL